VSDKRGPRRWLGPALFALLLLGAFAGTFVALKTLTSDPDEPEQASVERTESGDASSPSESAPPSPAESPSPTNGGIALHQRALDIIGSVVSQRNLSGLLVQVNQIDVCAVPELTAFVTVTDKQGGVFANVSADDFTVEVDGQEITDFEFSQVRSQDLPLSTVLVIDHSGSMSGAPMAETKAAAVDYVRRAARDDRVGLVQFDTRIDTLSEVTGAKASVINKIRQIGVRSDTALYDAVAAGVRATPQCGRKAVTLMTDGRDTASRRFTLTESIREANRANVPVFVVGLRSEQFTPRVLDRIASRTGAQYFETPSPSRIGQLYRAVDRQLAGQYMLRFVLDIPKTGEEHRLKISADVVGSPTFSSRSFIY
jgi:VWFA-related protein